MMDADDAAQRSFYSHGIEDWYSPLQPFLGQGPEKVKKRGCAISATPQRHKCIPSAAPSPALGAAALHCLAVLGAVQSATASTPECKSQRLPRKQNTEKHNANLFTYYDTLVLVTAYHLSKSLPLVRERA